MNGVPEPSQKYSTGDCKTSGYWMEAPVLAIQGPKIPKGIALVIAKWAGDCKISGDWIGELVIAKRVCCWMEAVLLAITTAHPKCEPGAPEPSQRYIIGGWKIHFLQSPVPIQNVSQESPRTFPKVKHWWLQNAWLLDGIAQTRPHISNPTSSFCQKRIGAAGLYEGQVVSQTCLEQDCGLMQDCVLMQRTSRIADLFW